MQNKLFIKFVLIKATGLPLLFVGLFTEATTKMVWLFGRETHFGCLFRDYFGIACPTCGLTRSVVLTVHGDFITAFNLNPFGVFLISALFLFGGLMIISAVLEMFNKYSQADFERKAMLFLFSYSLAATLFSIIFWVLRIKGELNNISLFL